jgi:HD-like signal output (HDOD) protein
LVFTAALLHDIGKLVLGKFLSADLRAWLESAVTEGKQPAYCAEREILALHHGEVGGLIAQHWGLPDSLVRGVTYHHTPAEGGDAICHVTYLANLAAHRLANEESKESSPVLSPLSDHECDSLTKLGLSEKDLFVVCEDACRGLQAVAGPMEKA